MIRFSSWLLLRFSYLCLLAALGLGQTSPAGQSAPTPAAAGPRGSVAGNVRDGTGGIIPGATLTLKADSGASRTAKSDADGHYRFDGVRPGSYTLTAIYPGLQLEAPETVQVLVNHLTTRDLAMTLEVQKQEFTVNDTVPNTVSTDPANNATALVLREEDLQALPDDPDDLAADLQALAGPGAGPGGNQIFIDGFTGGRLPPKESIREIRINSNPFSAEFDKVGFGRIQIFTKPGSDKFHGQGFYSISDDIWNSRNPFSNVNPPFRSQNFGGNVSGPISKKASFFVDVERRNIDDNGIIVASIPTPDFSAANPYSSIASNYFATPQRRTTVSPRVDLQLNGNNTLSLRYSYLNNDRLLTGIGSFNLPAITVGDISYGSSGYGTGSVEHEAQIVETAVLNPRTINEARFQYTHEFSNWASQSALPTLSVSQSFTAGGSGYGAPGLASPYDLQDGYEFQDYMSRTQGRHSMKFGIRIRATSLNNSNPRGYNGTYQFLGSSQISSIQQYLTTVDLLRQGMSSAAVTALGYGPSKYLVNTGNPYIEFSQMDFGPFFQDDWKVRPNLTVSLGLRWESQTNIPSQSNWAPRVAFAWSPDQHGGGRAKTVIRGGWGIFYDRFSLTNVQTVFRYASAAQQSYQLAFPRDYNIEFNSQIPLSELTAVASSNQQYQIDRTLQPPRLMQAALTLERQLFSRTTLNVNYSYGRGTHQLRTVDINAPVPIAGLLPPGARGYTGPIVRPYGSAMGDIYNYQSDGIYKHTQLSVGLNSQVGKRWTIFSRYTYTDSHSDTDGINTVANNPYDRRAEWGRSSLSFTHNLFFGGSVAAPWGFRFSPFLIAHSGQPFNVITGTDLYDQGLGSPTSRPALINPDDPRNPASYNPLPLVGTPVISRNNFEGAGFIGLNLRVSKTWGFGPVKGGFTPGGSGPGSPPDAGPGTGGGGSRGGGTHGGGGSGMRGGGGGSLRGGGGAESTAHRYNLTFSVNARNILNHNNPNTFNGSLTSPYFFRPTNITGGFGAEATASNQRRLDLQLRFSF